MTFREWLDKNEPTEEDIRGFIAQASLHTNTVNEFAKQRGCSRQYIDLLVKAGKLDSSYFRHMQCVLLTKKNLDYPIGRMK